MISRGLRQHSSSLTPSPKYRRVCRFLFLVPRGDANEVGILLQRFPISKVLGVNVFFWGVFLCCSAAAKNFAGMCALRVLLGMMEAVIGKSTPHPNNSPSSI